MALLTKYKSAFSFARRCRIVNSVRTYLSEEYAAIGKSSTASNIGTDMPSLCLSLDRCHEREFPISSLMIDRLVVTIESPDHLHGSKYYLHKFRFSENGYYLRPWTVHTFVEKCLKFDPEVLIDCLKNKEHYGIFPNQLSFNKTLNHFMKKKDLKNSIQVLTDMFLFEMLDNKSCQSLCLKVLSEYWAENLKEGLVIPEFDDVTEWRNVAGVFYCVGKLASLPSIKLIGESLLGLIELKHGIRTVYQDPWGPLSWEAGYLERALDDLESQEQVVSEESLDILLHCAADSDVSSHAEKVVENLKEANLTSTDVNLTIKGTWKSWFGDISKHEVEDMKGFQQTLQDWDNQRRILNDIEKDILKEYALERDRVFKEVELDDKAHLLAVERLGYWDLAKSEESNKSEEIFYLRKDYVEGAMNDLDILERYRAVVGQGKKPIILVS